jgi:hypothetical protein
MEEFDFSSDQEESSDLTPSKFQPGTLYFMRETDFLTGEKFDYIKIGIVKGERDILKREKEHRTGNPRGIRSELTLQTPAVQMVETFLHNKFSRHRVSSGEWFYLPGSKLDEVVEEAKNKISEIEKVYPKLEMHSTAMKSAHFGESLKADEELRILVEELARVTTDITENKKRAAALSKLLVSGYGSNPAFAHLFKFSSIEPTTKFDGSALRKDYKALYESFLSKEAVSWKYKILVSTKEPEAVEGPIETDDPLELHGKYLDAWSKSAELSWKQLELEAELFSKMGDATGIEDLIIWTKTTKRLFDKKAFESAHPDLVDSYTKTSPRRTGINVAEWSSYSR